MKFWSFLCLTFLMVSCANDTNSEIIEPTHSLSKEEFLTYFYPVDTVAYIYVYENAQNPMDVIYEKVWSASFQNNILWHINKFDANMNPIETRSLKLNDDGVELVKMIKQVGQTSYEANIQKSNYYSFNANDNIMAYDFPSTADSIVIVYRQEKFFQSKEMKDSLGWLTMNDSIAVMEVDVKNGRDRSFNGFMTTVYQEGIGKFQMSNGDINYRLKLRTKFSDWQQLSQ